MQLHIANLHCKCTGICTVTGYLYCKFSLFSKYLLTFVRKCGIIIRIYRTVQFLTTNYIQLLGTNIRKEPETLLG